MFLSMLKTWGLENLPDASGEGLRRAKDFFCRKRLVDPANLPEGGV